MNRTPAAAAAAAAAVTAVVPSKKRRCEAPAPPREQPEAKDRSPSELALQLADAMRVIEGLKRYICTVDRDHAALETARYHLRIEGLCITCNRVTTACECAAETPASIISLLAWRLRDGGITQPERDSLMSMLLNSEHPESVEAQLNRARTNEEAAAIVFRHIVYCGRKARVAGVLLNRVFGVLVRLGLTLGTRIGENGYTALGLACEYNSPAALLLLLVAPGCVDGDDANSRGRALGIAIRAGGSSELITQLLARSSDETLNDCTGINKRSALFAGLDRFGRTHVAAPLGDGASTDWEREDASGVVDALLKRCHLDGSGIDIIGSRCNGLGAVEYVARTFRMWPTDDKAAEQSLAIAVGARVKQVQAYRFGFNYVLRGDLEPLLKPPLVEIVRCYAASWEVPIPARMLMNVPAEAITDAGSSSDVDADDNDNDDEAADAPGIRRPAAAAAAAAADDAGSATMEWGA